MTKYNWSEIQKNYDNGLSYRDLNKKFGVSQTAINKARLRGEFKSKTHSDAVKNIWKHKRHLMSTGDTHSIAVGMGTKGKYKKLSTIKNIYDLSSRTRSKLLSRLGLKCCICGWDEETVDIHHILSRRKKGTNNHNNLTPLCPNHHRLADRGKIDISKLITLEVILGKDWKQYYFG